MGNKFTVCTLRRDEIASLVQSTHFTAAEIRALWFHFKEISSTEEDDGIIDRTEFQAAMLFRDSVLLERIFNVFDTNHDNGINFLEFISCLSTLSTKASPEEKIRLSFSIYDYDCDGFISKEELGHMLAATMREHEIILSPADVEGIIHSTFAEVRPSNPDKISFEEYRELISRKPHSLSILTLNISSIIQEYTDAHGLSLATPRDAQGTTPTATGGGGTGFLSPRTAAANSGGHRESSADRSVRKSSRAEGKGL